MNYPEYRAPITTVTPGPFVQYHWPTYEPTLQGWECPKCGRCYSPWTQKCESCGLFYTITITAGNAAEYDEELDQEAD